MPPLAQTLGDPATYRRLAYLLLEVPLATLWFVGLVVLWSLCAGFIVTPMVIPAALALAYATRGFTAIETEMARGLLDVTDAEAPVISAAGAGWRERVGGLFGSGFWRGQGYLWTRWLLAFPAGVLMLALIGSALAMILGPIWVPLVPGGEHFVGWHVHTFLQEVVLVPLGIVLLPLSVALARPLGDAFGLMAVRMLVAPGEAPRSEGAPGEAGPGHVVGGSASPSHRGLIAHAVADGAVVAVSSFVWLVTSRGTFWPIWVVLPAATALGIHAWRYELWHRPQLVRRFRGRRPLATTAGIAALFWLFTVGVWAASSHGYFWPVWTLLALAIVVGAHAATVLLAVPRQLNERIETLTSTRAGAVDAQESELRRIERDLHDGAQARLVALGMSLGMAEQKLAEDPDRVAELLAEARAGAEQALRELRSLARGIHPPVLTDRGLEAAIKSLTHATPMHVALSVDLPERPPAPVESAAYFVVAEALANATKHGQADWLEIRLATIGRRLELEITDDGIGGADPSGSGLVGLRQRVEALDGRLDISSPPGGPTTIHAELPCA